MSNFCAASIVLSSVLYFCAGIAAVRGNVAGVIYLLFTAVLLGVAVYLDMCRKRNPRRNQSETKRKG